MTREPGGTFGAEAIRDLVLEGTSDRWSGMTELLLMYAARLDHVEIHAAVMDGFEPDLTILFDIDPILAQKRVETRGEDLSRFDSESITFHNTLRDAFNDIAAENSERIFTIDAAASRDGVQTRRMI